MTLSLTNYTDEHLVLRGSSLDIIERCAAFVRQSGDFEGILDYGDDEETGTFQKLLHRLEKEAMRIIAKESC